MSKIAEPKDLVKPAELSYGIKLNPDFFKDNNQPITTEGIGEYVRHVLKENGFKQGNMYSQGECYVYSFSKAHDGAMDSIAKIMMVSGSPILSIDLKCEMAEDFRVIHEEIIGLEKLPSVSQFNQY